ncbi:L-rhamnose-proton symporter [Lunatimonas lonarensis]|uniref:L-rhamnose-proton symporter n=1 Tax=Lunatimonas lonarensis TaxID=1232681 RepID=R7ZLE9_9BACT|nr:rhamnose/proton symporter RhaT [Lunatimonas lonarensis]EON74913.1 L-rhamnose-proton symporter [Lunatimonas lonarensis]
MIVGIVLHALGGFAAGSFYIPIARIKNWKWESGWIISGVFAWLITPWLVAFLTVPDLGGLWGNVSWGGLFWPFFFGILWGIGGLTFGLTMRYLGISLGMAIALGFSALFGTLIPPLYEGRLLASLAEKPLVIPGVLLCFIGIVIAGLAGARKEKELSKEQKQASVKEANFPLGILVATVSGIMSACFAFGLAAGTEVADVALAQGTPTLWQSNPVLILVMLGGFVTNFLWCLGLNIKNRSFQDYTKVQPLTKNYLLAGTAGIVWYHQFMFYGMGSSFLGRDLDFVGWTLHMAFIIMFSNFWGLYFKEWKGVSKQTKRTLYLGLATILTAMLFFGLATRG